MRFSTWSESGLNISREEITSLFAPFMATKLNGGNPEWRSELSERKRSILRDYLKCVLFLRPFRGQHDNAAIIDEYSKAWHPDRRYR
jgi:hypothetical protein